MADSRMRKSSAGAPSLVAPARMASTSPSAKLHDEGLASMAPPTKKTSVIPPQAEEEEEFSPPAVMKGYNEEENESAEFAGSSSHLEPVKEEEPEMLQGVERYSMMFLLFAAYSLGLAGVITLAYGLAKGL